MIMGLVYKQLRDIKKNKEKLKNSLEIVNLMTGVIGVVNEGSSGAEEIWYL